VALAARVGLAPEVIETAIARLEAEGFLLRGRFDPDSADLDHGTLPEVCERRLLARIHRYTVERLRREIEPVTAQDFLRFLLRWQHVAPDARLHGRPGVLTVIEQLQGFEIAAGQWEESILPTRVDGYRQEWLDSLCLSGAVMWARLAPRPVKAASQPSRATPVSLLVRDNLPWLLAAGRGAIDPTLPEEGAARDVLACLEGRGALFFGEIVSATGRLRVEVEDALWELVGQGLLTADGFGAVRALLDARERWARRALHADPAGRLRRSVVPGIGAEGRWSLLTRGDTGVGDVDTLADAVAEQLLARYGVVVRDLLVREPLALPWREIQRALRRLEARGIARGGRFVTGFVGEQYALPEAVDGLRHTRRRPRTGELVRVAAVDPLNLAGILTPGPRVPALGNNAVIYRDGMPVDSLVGRSESAGAG
jgi:ATP-dependent helicase Lhr and Lhr-like helicase